jgi:hypothetical protein
MAATPAAAQANAIQAENALPGSAWEKNVASPAVIDGYTASPSVAPGDQLRFHVTGDPSLRYRVEIYRTGWYQGLGARRVACLPGCAADEPVTARPPAPAPDPDTFEVRAGWPVTDEMTVPQDWVSGVYFAETVVTSGASAGADRLVPFVVRAAAGTDPAAVVVMIPASSWQMANEWGGYGHYTTPQATHMSWERPYHRYDFLRWEYPMDKWLEREGVDMTYVADVDVDRAPELLLDHRLAVSPGLSEYWSRTMRTAFETSLADGGNLFFPGGNSVYSQIRYADDRHVIVAYQMPYDDPEPDPWLKTTYFRDLVPPDPECRLTGVRYADGSFFHDFYSADYVVTAEGAADPWMAGTGLSRGDTLTGLVGHEFSGRDPDCPTPEPGVALLEYGGGQAEALRFHAPSGGLVFTGGSLQFAWGLDGYRYTTKQADIPTSPGLQAMMRNALPDLLAPVAPKLTVSTTATGYRLSATTPDPRNGPLVIRRRASREAFAPDDPDAVVVCRGSENDCVDEPPTLTPYRYLVTTTDRWGGTASTLSPADQAAPAGTPPPMPTTAAPDASGAAPTLRRPPPAFVGRRNALIEFDAAPGTRTLCALDGDAPRSCTSPVILGHSNPGPHRLRLENATSGAGTEIGFVVDPAAPRIRIASPGRLVRRGAPRSVRFSCGDSSGIVRCDGSLPDGSRVPDRTRGRHVLRVTAVDRAGNRRTVVRHWLVR